MALHRGGLLLLFVAATAQAWAGGARIGSLPPRPGPSTAIHQGSLSQGDRTQILPSTDAILAALFSAVPEDSCAEFVTDVVLHVPDDLMLKLAATYGASSFPTDQYNFLLLGSGNIFKPLEGDDLDVPPLYSSNQDQAHVEVYLDIPPGIESISFDMEMFSYEYPEYVGTPYNDFAFVYLDGTYFSYKANDGLNQDPGRPDTDACLLTYDALGNMTDINSVFFEGCDEVGCDDGMGRPGWEAFDDDRDEIQGNDAGRTGGIHVCAPLDYCTGISSGPHRLIFTVGDVSDGGFTTVGLFDNLRCHNSRVCDEPGMQRLPCEAAADAGPDRRICPGKQVVLSRNQTTLRFCMGETQYRWLLDGQVYSDWDFDAVLAIKPAQSVEMTLEVRCLGTDDEGNPAPYCPSSDSMAIDVIEDLPPEDLANTLRAVKTGQDVSIVWSGTSRAVAYEGLGNSEKTFEQPLSIAEVPDTAFTDLGALPASEQRPALYFYRFRGLSCSGTPGL